MTPDQVESARPQAKYLARKYGRMYRMEPCDLEQAALLGLFIARSKFNPARSSWPTFARVYMLGAIRRYCMKHARVIRIPEHERQQARNDGRALPPDTVSMDLQDDDGNPYMSRLGSTDGVAVIEHRDMVRALHSALAKLPANERTMIEERYLDGIKQGDQVGRVARTRGMVQAQTYQILHKLRKHIEVSHAR